LPSGVIAINIHPTKGEQCRCGMCERKVVCYVNGRGTVLGELPTGIQIRSIFCRYVV